ncbi:ABC transporter substrate-binding protein [Dermacoccus sp. PAMC28757]|uniref:ABC transporter substrate-binding protein n=1 Tax=Dermacoccus TaxID=57495 RepID=UPI00164DBB5C|nr:MULTISPECIES: ABC transporter substrate-binding protein [Dermacoccus]QNK51786.1 ABC transporter substrate-binding protein [Dermacoccus sp. PAMC28757]
MTTLDRPSRRAVLAAAVGAPFALPALTACGAAEASPHRLRLGYFANVTHGVAVAGMARGTFAERLPGVRLEPQIFPSGPSAVQAMLAGALDVAYLGPNPAITAWVRTKGQGVRLVAGGASGGAALVARKGIESVEGLRGRRVSTPQLGGTQDVALKTLLREKGISTGSGKDAVEVLWMANSQTLDQFKQNRLDASYQAEPWVSRLVEEAGAHVLVDERTRWPGGRFATTCVVVSEDYRRRCPEQVEALLGAHVDTVRWIRAHRDEASTLLNSEIERIAGKKLKPTVIERAMRSVEFGWDPMLTNVAEVAEHTWATGGIEVKPNLHGIADLAPLNRALAARSLERADDGGYGARGKA